MNINLPAFLYVAIGLSFIYLILSLLASEIQELFADWHESRAKQLKQSIYILLGGSGNLSDFGGEPTKESTKSLKDKLIELYKQDKKKAWELTKELYENSLIASISTFSLGLDEKAPKSKYGPSYIPSETFAIALVEILKEV
ncbi:MAG: hypothetical protein KME08_21565 [Aphanothece sp. CMT-3BRIN-NPC111]|jgi:hypothetical protein|nr:hypothetical protein [Aphanothece sp. CMT-3BRIN-NPC111]